MRFLLQQEKGDKPSLDLLDGYLNSRYEQVLEATDWTGVRARTILESRAAYVSGVDKVTLTVGSAAVVGTGTGWTDAVLGLGFYRPGDAALYTVSTRGGATALTLERPYEGNGVDPPGTAATDGYVLMQNLYPLPADCRAVEQILSPSTGLPLTQFTQDELNETAGLRTLVGEPESFAMIEDSPEINGNVVHQIELFPPPRFARGYTVEYLRAAYMFTGQNLGDSPLPFVSQTVLLMGTRADIAMWRGDLTQAQGYEAKFQDELRRLLLVEHAQRRAKPSLRMDPRFTRHRLRRLH